MTARTPTRPITAAPPGVRFEGRARIGGAPLFGPLTLDLPAAKWTCLLGPSGVGKTTILRLIAGLESGVTFEGRITADDSQPLTGRVALMAQDDLLLPWLDVPGNVTLGARLRGESPDHQRARTVLQEMGLTPHRHKRPHQLSGGQRQRVALARTLMEDRTVLLLDEPFSALDARTRAQMQDLAAQTLRGRTVLIVTHDPAEAARLGEQIVILSDRGADSVAPPPGAIPRPADAAETLQAQAALLRRLQAGN